MSKVPSEVIERVRTHLLQYLGDYPRDIERVKAAKTLGDLADAAQQMAFDYPAFMNIVWKAFEEKESALYNIYEWDT